MSALAGREDEEKPAPFEDRASRVNATVAPFAAARLRFAMLFAGAGSGGFAMKVRPFLDGPLEPALVAELRLYANDCMS